MACFNLDENNYLKKNDLTLDECTSFIVIDSNEYKDYKLYSEFTKLPPREELEEVFLFSFSFLMLLYFTVFGIKKVIQVLKI